MDGWETWRLYMHERIVAFSARAVATGGAGLVYA
jgi:hypothetical protein